AELAGEFFPRRGRSRAEILFGVESYLFTRTKLPRSGGVRQVSVPRIEPFRPAIERGVSVKLAWDSDANQTILRAPTAFPTFWGLLTCPRSFGIEQPSRRCATSQQSQCTGRKEDRAAKLVGRANF